MNPLDHPICLASPKRLTAVKSWHEHIPFGMFLVDLLRPRLLVELGTHAGDSYCAFCQAVKELNLDTRCYAVDTWRGDSHSGFYDHTILDDLRAHHDPLYGSFSSLFPSTFDDALGSFADQTIDLLHIDGYHTYEAVKHDFQLWLPKLSADGVVLLHDTTESGRDFGISQLWDEIKPRYPSFEFLHGHGLGVLAVGKVRSKELQAIVSGSPDDAVTIRSFFYQLGRRLSLSDEAEALEQALEKAEEQLIIAKRREQSPNEQFAQQDRPSLNALQLFWDDGCGFSEANSLEEPLIANGLFGEYLLRLPERAAGPFRLDPGNRTTYIEIDRIDLIACIDETESTGDVLLSWSAVDDFAGLIAVSGISRLSGHQTYRFICSTQDPQLVLTGLPDRIDSRPWMLKVSLRVSEHLKEIMANELDSINRELDGKRVELTELASQIAEALAQLAQERTTSQSLAARLGSREQDLQESLAQLSSERKRTAETEKQIQSQSIELAKARGTIDSLAAQLGEEQKAAAPLRVRLAVQEEIAESLRGTITRQNSQLEADAQIIQALTSESERHERQLRETDRQLQEREHQLRRITRSLGWRVLSRYGRLKHRFLLPAYRRLRDFINLLLQTRYRPALQPLHDLRLLDETGVWEAVGRDPQFNLVGKWPNGWIEIALRVEPECAVAGHARLYVDRGAGYSEDDSYDLGDAGDVRESIALLGPEVVGLRLDPFESAGRFRISRFDLKLARARPPEDASGAQNGAPSSFSPWQFAQFALARAGSFRQKNGRPPRLRELPAAVRRTLRAWAKRKPNGSAPAQETVPVSAAPNASPGLEPLEAYDAWLEVNQWNARRESLLRERLSTLKDPRLLSVVMPVHHPPPEFLDKAIASVASQVYQNWELCIAGDSGTDPAIRELLQRWADDEPRIRVVFNEANAHTSRATNAAAEITRGDYIAMMYEADEITPDALGEVAVYLAENPGTDVLYTDDDKISELGHRFAPQFKPDWSPELLLSYMYFSHFFVLRRSLFMEAGGLGAGYDGSQDYDLALRVTDATDRVGHIPKVLYHCRVLPGTTASSGGVKPESFRSGLQAVQEALDRRGIRATAYQPAMRADAVTISHRFSDDGPRVAIIIHAKNNVAMLKRCVASLDMTTYRNYEVVIVDTESSEEETLEYLRRTQHRVLRIPNSDGQLSSAAINNQAVGKVTADCVLFLNSDTEVLTPEWLSQMVGYLGLPGVGAVGARLLFPDGRLQHAGIIHGYYNGLAGPAFKLLPGSDYGYLSYAMVARNYSAVMAACLLTSKDLFSRLRGFDEQNFAVAYNDVDYCYRLGAAGQRVVYCPTAELIHHQGCSPGIEDSPAGSAALRKKYGAFRDPFYNPNLSLSHERFAVDSRTVAPSSIKPIRTLMCAFNLNWEGAPYSQFELTVRLREGGVIDPIVYCPMEGPLRAAYEARGIQVEVFDHPLSGVHELNAYERAIEGYASRIADWNAELVYANTRQTFYAIDAATRLGLPSIWNPRESEPWQTYFDYLGPEIARRALQCFHYPYRVVFVAETTRESCLPLNAHHNFITIHNALDRERFAAGIGKWPREKARRELKVAPGEMAVLLAGTVCERKGQMDLVEAVARMGEESVGKLRCFIVGERGTDYSNQLESAIKRLPISTQSRIELAPETSDIALYYSAADLSVLTSRMESFPRVILEAMAAGLPIITTPVFGVCEQVRENINALFYSPGDAAALADHIERLLREPLLRQKLAGNSRPVLDALSDFEAMVSAYASVFREAWLSGRSR